MSKALVVQTFEEKLATVRRSNEDRHVEQLADTRQALDDQIVRHVHFRSAQIIDALFETVS